MLLPEDVRELVEIDLANHDIVSGEGADRVAEAILRFAQLLADAPSDGVAEIDVA